MNKILFLMTTTFTLISLNYIALKIKNRIFIESNVFFAVPILTGTASIIMMMQPLNMGFELDLRFLPIIMAGIRFGLPMALLSTILPFTYYLATNEMITIHEISLSLIIPALISSVYHRKEYINGVSLIRLIDSIKICLAYVIMSLTIGYFFVSVNPLDWIFFHMILLVISCAAMTLLISMYNHENKLWLVHRELELQANQDELTKLPNLRSFMKICTNSLRKRRISILMIDIDYFKVYNDQLGHPQGDQLLREIGFILRHSIGEKDYLARYGGEEFIIMCHSVNKIKLGKFGKNLCRLIANHPFSGREVQPNQHISISVGISIATKVNDDLQKLIMEADDALYKSKNAGRNQFNFNQTSLFDL